ncbi:MAG: hypothetical protein HY438_02305 [DPANN group archaeon]|nr:hypothetical protein [DPANN group archaeon]
MTGKLIVAPDYKTIEGALVFLAGPIQGAPRWQEKAIKYLQLSAPEINIANPRRPDKHYSKGEFPPELYAEQVDWETFHLKKAGECGVILFWLAREAEHKCHRAYGQATRFELSEWKVKHERDFVKLAVGIEEGFTGARYIARRFSQDCPSLRIFTTLEETCQEAIRLV